MSFFFIVIFIFGQHIKNLSYKTQYKQIWVVHVFLVCFCYSSLLFRQLLCALHTSVTSEANRTLFFNLLENLTYLLHYQAVDAVTPTENRRRSARLNSKGRTSTEGLDEDTEPKPPVLKRSRKSRENGNDGG
jgi:hypothetical protein